MSIFFRLLEVPRAVFLIPKMTNITYASEQAAKHALSCGSTMYHGIHLSAHPADSQSLIVLLVMFGGAVRFIS